MKKKKGGNSGEPTTTTTRITHNERLKKSIVKTRNAIRKKFRDLHSQKAAVKLRVSETFEPIITPIKNITKSEKKVREENTEFIKKEKKEEPFWAPDSVFKTAVAPHRANLFQVTPETSGAQSKFHEISGIDTLDKDNDAEDEFENRIIDQVKRVNSPYVDHTYGFKYKKGHLYLGKDKVFTKKTPSGIIYSVNKKGYRATPGVSELLLSSSPNPHIYNTADLKTYRKMLEHTSAHKINFNPDGPINRENPTSKKYINIISKLFPATKSGTNYSRKPQTKYKVVNKQR